MCIHFNEDVTTIHFLVPPAPLMDSTEVAFPTFQVPENTPALWHHWLCHLGMDAT